MSTVSIELPEEVYNRLAQLARIALSDVDQFVTNTLVSVYQGVQDPFYSDPFLATLSDAEVLARANTVMPRRYSKRYSDLLEKQGEGRCSAEDKSELDILLRIYQLLSLRKAAGTKEAIRRGLMPPLQF